MKSTNLTLPIAHPPLAYWRVVYTDIFTDKPSGFELASTIVANIYIYWRDDANRPIRSKQEFRRLPYTKFLHTVEPSLLPGASLTPQIIGQGYKDCLHHIATMEDWPGHFTARLRGRERPGTPVTNVGSIWIDNSPLSGRMLTARTLPGTGLDNVTSSGTGLSVTPTDTRRWLTCFARVYYITIAHRWSARVTDDPNMRPQPITARYRHRCPGGDDTWEMIVYPAANNMLTWDELNQRLVRWVGNVAADPGSYLSKETIANGETVLVELQIRLKGAGAEQQDAAVATA
ncbi:MAG: hypothetical protein L6R40_006455 [Gallowayella cf. fulva]|nr:MAG: hypothetical protein L6R40_006455 [Xanthomendoza cf. fulva]